MRKRAIGVRVHHERKGAGVRAMRVRVESSP